MACLLFFLLAIASSLAVSSGVDAITIVVTGTPGAPGGGGVDGEPGGPADATAISSDPANEATATGGQGGSGVDANGGAGGDASATAETNAAGPASAIATATGGNGGDATGFLHLAGAGGSARAAAHASGAGGSEARAFATGGQGGNGAFEAFGAGGGDAVLVDAVSGSDPMALELEQRATGGPPGNFGDEGAAASTGDFENPAGGDLHAIIAAVGSTAHIGGSATSTAGGDATLEATARANGGALVIDPLVAVATGSGDASASLEAEQLAGGGTLSLMNRVDAIASSAAALALRQTAKAEAASESILDVTRSAALLDLEANAEGGDATIFVRGSNDAGDLHLGGEAIGGRDASVDPFAARAEFEAHTSGDGHAIEIGSVTRPARAIGGEAGHRPPTRGGDAEVIATGIALGNSAVRIDVVVEGGDGSEFHGGNATVRAEGSGGGTEAVEVIAAAIGDPGLYAIGGDADADAVASGHGYVRAAAVAHGGVHDSELAGGAGFARARASGATGQVEAAASSAILFDGEQADDEQEGPIEVRLSASVAGEAAVAASSRLLGFAPGSDDAAFDGFVRSAYQADPSLLGDALAGNPHAMAAGPPDPDDELFALVETGLRSGGGTGRTFTTEIVLGRRFSEFDDLPEAVLVSFLDPEIDAAAFGSLTLRSWDERDPGDVYEIVFASALDALAFLDDGRLVFGGLPQSRHLEIVFETTGAEGAFFLDLVVAAVPEPSAALLLALGLLVMGLRRAW